MACFGTTDFDNNSRLITLSTIIISGLHCTTNKNRMVYTSATQIKHGYQPTLNTCTAKQGTIAFETEVMNKRTDNCQDMSNKNGDNVNTQ